MNENPLEKTDKAAPAAKSSKEFTLIRHTITIERDVVTKIADTVYDHELPLLYEVEGDEKVEVVETVEIAVADFDVGVEYDRLLRKYEKRDKTVVSRILGRTPMQLANQLGIRYTDSMIREKHEPEQSMSEVGENPAIRKVIKKATPKLATAAKAKVLKR